MNVKRTGNLFNSNGMGWQGGNFKPDHLSIPPLISYVVRLTHKGLRLGSYSEYQTSLSNKVIHLRDEEKLTFKDIADLLINEGWSSPRGFSLGAESVFSIYKKRKIRDARLLALPTIEIVSIQLLQLYPTCL